MGKQRSTFAKLQRDKAKKEKAQERAAARSAKNQPDPFAEAASIRERSVEDLVGGVGEPSPDELLEIVEELTRRHTAGDINDEEFEEAKVELFARLG